VIHGDIKGTNILVDEKLQARITDFGLSRILIVSGLTTTTQAGTWRYMAYELLVDEAEPVQRTNATTDVWAFGMTVVEMLVGAVPFSHIKNPIAVITSVVRGDRPKREHCPQISNEMFSMLEQCWKTEPSQRPTMDTLSSFVAEELELRSTKL